MIPCSVSSPRTGAAQRVLKLHPSFTIRALSLTIGLVPAVFAPFAQAWVEAGLPEQ